MPVIPLNHLAIVVAAIAHFILGFLWYGPVFGNVWIKLMKIPQSKVDEMKAKGMGPMLPRMGLSLVMSLIVAYVMAHSLVFATAFLGISGVMAGIQAGFWNWLGFSVPVNLNASLWEEKSWQLFAFNCAYYLVAFMLVGVIIAVWPA